MTLDDEKQRQILLQLINAATVPGQAVEMVVALKSAIASAKVEEKS